MQRTSDETNSKENFAHWFVGFVDSEGFFGLREDKRKIRPSFIFTFEITLHKDDLEVLKYIKSKLQIGTLYFNSKISRFTVTKRSDFFKLFELFEIKNLNTTKILNYKS